MQTVNIDSNDFGEIRSRGYVYVDKTAWFHRLATAEGRKLFFLARPRRFGKSLMISTFEAMFRAMLYQTGYLTIDKYENGLFTLRVPDEEVRQDLAALMGKTRQFKAGVAESVRLKV